MGQIRSAWFGLLSLCAILACAGRATELSALELDGASRFLSHCEPGGCGGGTSCLFGVCTALCEDDSDCGAFPGDAACRRGGRKTRSANAEQLICDVDCNESADCRALGPGFRCEAGACRAGTAEASTFSRACSDDSQCTGELRCLDHTCSQPCESHDDCGRPGLVCEPYSRGVNERVLERCVQRCGFASSDLFAQHDECAFLGDGGRCTDGTCRETSPGQCGDIGQPGAEWSCYEDIATDVFRRRQPLLEREELCLESKDGKVSDVEYRLCAADTCAGGQAGCAVSGLVFESGPLDRERGQPQTPRTLLATRGEVRLKDAVRLHFDLRGSGERCEYAVRARFWNIQYFAGYAYVSPTIAAERRSSTAGFTPNPGVERGFWRVMPSAALGHIGKSTPGALFEDSEAEVTLLSGGERCSRFAAHVGTLTRNSLAQAVNTALLRWGESVGESPSDAVECTACGLLGCELACRFR